MKTYVFVYLGSLLLSLLATPLVAQLARRLRIYDMPDSRKVHAEPIPRIGGVAIAGAFFVVLVPVLLLDNLIGRAFDQMQTRVLVVLAGAFVVFLTGLIDDLRGVKPQIKLAVLVVAASAVWWSGGRIDDLWLGDFVRLSFASWSWLVTVAWIVAVTVAINFIDGLDGLAAGISAIVCGVLAILASYNGEIVMAVVALCLLGALSAFLYYNFNPARIFMGDSGSMFLGFTLGSTSIICTAKAETLVALVVPAIALGVPLVDAMLTLVRRGVIQRRSLFAAERGHVHHRLLDLGLSHRSTMLLLCSVTALLAVIAVLVLYGNQTVKVIATLAGCLALMSLFRSAGSMRLREILRAWKRNRTMDHNHRTTRRAFEDGQLRFRTVATFEEWWNEICLALNEMEIGRLSIPLRNRDGTQRVLRWAHGSFDERASNVVRVTLPVRHRRIGDPLQAMLEVPVTDGRLEAAGRKVAVLSRLLEEHSVASLPDAPIEPRPVSAESARVPVMREVPPAEESDADADPSHTHHGHPGANQS